MADLILNAYEMGKYYADHEDEFLFADIYDDFQYGMTEDGYIIPGPCPIDGAPMNTCVIHYGLLQ